MANIYIFFYFLFIYYKIKSFLLLKKKDNNKMKKIGNFSWSRHGDAKRSTDERKLERIDMSTYRSWTQKSEFNIIKTDELVLKTRINNPESFSSDLFLFKRTTKKLRPSRGSKIRKFEIIHNISSWKRRRKEERKTRSNKVRITETPS